MKNTTLLYVLVLLTSLSACNTKSKNDQIQNSELNSEAQEKDESESKELKIIGDSIAIPSFEIQLELSKKAEEKLLGDDETINVLALINGEGKSDSEENVPVTLASSSIELTDKRNVVFKNIKFSKADYNALKDKNIWVTVEVSSGRKASNGNFLDVDFLEENIENVINKKFVLKGKLVYE